MFLGAFPFIICSRIVDTMRTGSGSLPASKARGQTFRRNAIAMTRSASAFIFIALTTRYDKLAANYLAFKLASIRIWLRANEFRA